MIWYRIQTCKSRLWYVEEYLVPSMLRQGIPKNAIKIWLDKDEVGNLEWSMQNFKNTDGVKDDYTWFLQDDVIICSDFKERTQQEYDTLVAGFCANIAHIELKFGRCGVRDMWNSFPCNGMPNWLANKCADWYYGFAKKSTQFNSYVSTGKMDDTLFWMFMQDYSDVKEVINIAPNLVEHIDYLIGGSVVNPERGRNDLYSSYWNEPELIDELKEKLNERKNRRVHRES